jgi:hypothetical protein
MPRIERKQKKNAKPTILHYEHLHVWETSIIKVGGCDVQ